MTVGGTAPALRGRRSRATLLACAACIACGLVTPASAAPAAPDTAAMQVADLLGRASDAISELHLDEAEKLLTQATSSHPGLPLLQFEQARLLFYRGSYVDAVALADRAISGAHGHDKKPWEAMRDLMAATEQVTHAFERTASPDGRYIVLCPPGKDTLLAGYALDVVAKADHALQQAFGIALPGPIRIEIYSSPETLAQVSALTVEQIQTTGTVALSKWNRLMITSPKALVRGYPWADTITHELVHMVVSRITGDRAPVWLQEGTAKLFERSWRERGAELVLDPPARALLHDANAKNKLITFEQMYPSIAMLPSEDDAALAFAQVATFMQTYVQRHGQAALRDALSQVEHGTDAREALGKAAAQSFAKIEAEWKASLPQKPEGVAPTRRLKPRFRVGDGPNDESTEVVEGDARRFLRIGDLLWDRGRVAAAAHEYEKAHHADREDPIVAARWARAALESGNAHAAIEALEPQASRYPGHAPTHALLGAAKLQLGERADASAALREAIWINPFDPDPHCNLARASQDIGEVGREQKACAALK
jgi:tetratricopeptide (TPR) repeat protein